MTFLETGNVQVLSIQVTLFFAGVGTLFFHFCTKWKVPAFLGSSFAFLGGFSTIASLNTGIYKGMEAGTGEDPLCMWWYCCCRLIIYSFGNYCKISGRSESDAFFASDRYRTDHYQYRSDTGFFGCIKLQVFLAVGIYCISSCYYL